MKYISWLLTLLLLCIVYNCMVYFHWLLSLLLLEKTPGKWFQVGWFLFLLELLVGNNWHALERYLISDWNVLRCDRAIQVSAVWKCKTKQTLKTQWSTWSHWGIFLLHESLNLWGLFSDFCIMWLHKVWASYVQPHS